MALIKYIIKLSNKKRQTPDNDNLLNTKKIKIPSFLILSFTMILGNLFFVSYFTWDYATRYLIASIPFFYILSAAFIIKFFKRDKIALLIFVTVLMSTNIFHELPYFITQSSIAETAEAVIKPPVNYYYDELDKATLTEYLSGLKIKSPLLKYTTTYLKDYDNADKAAVKFINKYVEKDQYVYSMSLTTYSVMYHTNAKMVYFYENPNDLIITESYINGGRPITWAQNLKYFYLSYRPTEYIDWIIVNTVDVDGDTGFIPTNLLEKITDNTLYERFDIHEYPNAPVTADIWAYTYETNHDYPGITIFRNRLTTSPINVPNIITKEQLK
jgi:hypothetical protein